jgi:hypothetical protein
LLGKCCEEIGNQLNRGNTAKLNEPFRKIFVKPKIKNIIIESKEGKTLAEDLEIADREQHYIEELYNDSENSKNGKEKM